MEKSKQLSVETYHLEELKIRENPLHHKQDASGRLAPQPLIEANFNAFLHQTDLSRFAVSLRVRTQEPLAEEHPLEFSVRIMGFFRVAEPFADRKLHSERVVNGLTILYGLVRANVGTAAAWFGEQLIMPTVYFSDLVNRKIADAKKAEVSEPEQQLIEAAV